MEVQSHTNPEAQLNSKDLTPEFIRFQHKIRRELQRGIQQGDLDTVKEKGQLMFEILGKDELNILKRVENKVRAYKNIILSLNTLYSCEAENGGLSPFQTHLISEKYAIMIEQAENSSQFEEIHLKMLEEYTDPTIRITRSENLSIVERAEKYLELNFAEEISIEGIAWELHINPSHLMREFKKEKGTTISKYRNHKRIEKAKELMVSSNLSMTDISIMVGFRNSQYFSTLFKKIEGITPVEFKRIKKNN
ncbi:helix-turn-helix transcriptional regulator [Oceanobacillus arenosus]|nr:AraC family transcriptional regulator [Oceanobacillus arenosus]